jgi:hypothetical protein
MSTAAHTTAMLTLLLPLNGFTRTKHLLLCLLLLTLGHTDFAASPEWLYNDHTPPLMSNVTHPTSMLTLLLPLNDFTMTILLL